MKEQITARGIKAGRKVVGIADMSVSDDHSDSMITFSLGSCLGITAYDPDRRIGGLIHVMLPVQDGRKKNAERPFMYVDTGVSFMINRLIEMGASKQRLVIKAAGGGNMQLTSGIQPLFQIGKRNFLALRKLLWKNNMLLKSHDVGGNRPRTLWIELDTGDVFVRSAGAVRKL